MLPPPYLPFSCNWTQPSLQSKRIKSETAKARSPPQFCFPHRRGASDRWKLNSSKNLHYKGLSGIIFLTATDNPAVNSDYLNFFLNRAMLTSSLDSILVQTTIIFRRSQQETPNWLLIPITPLYNLFSTEQSAFLKTKSDHAVPPTFNSPMAFYSLSYLVLQEKVKIDRHAFQEKCRSSKSFCLPNLR